MAKKPLNQMSDRGYDKMSEESGYILHELKTTIKNIVEQLKDTVSHSDLSTIWKSSESNFVDKQANRLTVAIVSALREEMDETKINLQKVQNIQQELGDSVANITNTIINSVPSKEDVTAYISSLAALSNVVDDMRVRSENITISSAELLSLFTNPKTIIAAPGGGKYIEILNLELFLDFETTPYAGVDDLSVEYTSGTQIKQISGSGFVDQSADERRRASDPNTLTLKLNEGVMLKMLTADPTAGDSPLKVRVDYRIKDAIV